MYGARLTRDFGESVPDPWRSAVKSLSDSQIQRGLRRLTAAGSGSTPTLPQFVKACKAPGDDEGTARPELTYRPQSHLPWQVRTGNCTLLSFLLSKGGVSADLMPKLVETKNKIVATAHNDDDAAELGNVLRAAFERVAT
jgi:hypothetical protein